MNNNLKKGKLKRWNDDKGFGFIGSEGGRRDVFVHISALKRVNRHPIVGDVIGNLWLCKRERSSRTVMKPIINALNWLSDQDWSWWPLLMLRPEKSENITNALVLKLTPVFGTLSGLAIAAIAQHSISIPFLLFDIAIGWVAYFVLYRAIFVPAWNSRAGSMRERNT